MRSQDVITYKQEFFKNLSDKASAKLLHDKNYCIMLKALRKGPMTIDEILDRYASENNEKALKTIYRYIKVLQDAKLVVEAGKRIVTDKNNKNKSITLYSRTARLFNDTSKNHSDSISDEDREMIAKGDKVLALFLSKLYDGKMPDMKKLAEFYTKVYSRGQEFITKYYDQLGIDVFEQIENYDFIQVDELVRLVMFLAMTKKHDLKKELDECFK